MTSNIQNQPNAKVSELSGAALDWAVAMCESEDYSQVITYDGIGNRYEPTNYSTDWAQGGPIIEKEMLCVNPDYPRGWMAITNNAEIMQLGSTALIAAMRCYVASKLGNDVYIPSKLLAR